MTDWLRFIGMIFYAPIRGMAEVRDRGSLLVTVIVAFVSQLLYAFLIQWLAGNRGFLTKPQVIGGVIFHEATLLLPIALILVPVLAMFANLFDRRGSFGIVLQQEYAPLACVVFYGLVGANVAAILFAVFLHFTGLQASWVAALIQQAPETMAMWRRAGAPDEFIAQQQQLVTNPVAIATGLFAIAKVSVFVFGLGCAIREIFRPPVWRAIAIVLLSCCVVVATSNIWGYLFHAVVGSPFLLLFAFLLLRGYFTGVVSNQRARAAFKQNLEAATINPRDSSAHYNLGLIHQTRGELSEARERFQRAIEIDPDELDAHYQLGRIARAQGRLAEAISHFEQVVQRDQSHAQNEIWREIGATYIAAGQYADGREALQKFLNRRENDPEALYLMGRAHAGLGDNQEAATSMQACIDAVKTAPAYKYRTEKRWLNEAQQFLKGKRQQAVSK